MDAGLVPVKRFDRAKSRLAPSFDAAARAAIARALWRDSLALIAANSWLSWWVVSDEQAVLSDAAGGGAATVSDAGNGLNAALDQAVSVLRRAGAESVIIVPCDVPLAFSGDLRDLADTGATSDVVVVPSGEGGGTNALYMSPVDLMAPRFGEASLAAHIAEAERLGARCTLLNLPRLALDIDTPADVEAFLGRPHHSPTHTAEVLGRLRAGR
jgi:2-phospho-L-lactate/phosphoenolpyruvate guanylyltransferase